VVVDGWMDGCRFVECTATFLRQVWLLVVLFVKLLGGPESRLSKTCSSGGCVFTQVFTVVNSGGIFGASRLKFELLACAQC
jgi:hypothetical protein